MEGSWAREAGNLRTVPIATYESRTDQKVGWQATAEVQAHDHVS